MNMVVTLCYKKNALIIWLLRDKMQRKKDTANGEGRVCEWGVKKEKEGKKTHYQSVTLAHQLQKQH